MEMACNFKTFGRFYQVFAFESQIKSVKLILASFCFKIHLILFARARSFDVNLANL